MEFDNILHTGYALILTRSGLGSLFFANLKKVMAIVRILYPLNILKMNLWNLRKFCICIDIDKL